MTNKIDPIRGSGDALRESGGMSSGARNKSDMHRMAGHPILSRCSMAFIIAAAVLAPLQAAQCSLDSTPSPMLAAGLAEPLGDLVLRCSLGAPGSALQGLLILGIDGTLANRIDDQKVVLGLTITVDNGALQSPIPGATATTDNGRDIFINGVAASFDASGNVTLRLSGLRAATSAVVRAGLGFAGSPALNISPQTVEVGFGVDSFFTTTPDALLQPYGNGLKGLDPKTALVGMLPNLTARITESDLAAFHAKLATDSAGTRMFVRFLSLPSGSRLFAPDAIAGSDADASTKSGWFGTASTAGGYVLGTAPATSLLLARVKAAALDGSGGQFAWQPQTGAHSLAGVALSEADYTPDGSPYFLYEVAGSSPLIRESAEIPVYAFAGPTTRNGLIAVRAALQLAPIPAATVAAATTPIPRYTGNDVTAPDCTVLLDCTAKWFPELRVQANSASSRMLQATSGSVQGFLALTNTGGGVALWSASVDYAHGPQGWLPLGFGTGFVADQIGLTYLLAPSSMRPGMYHAEIVFTLTNSPDGSKPTVTQPIELIVMPHPGIRR